MGRVEAKGLINSGEGGRRGWDVTGQDIPREMGKFPCFRAMHGIRQMEFIRRRDGGFFLRAEV